ncbi:hypothetical protein MBLNU230_g3268t1 [Neophaeotheca triangularis]
MPIFQPTYRIPSSTLSARSNSLKRKRASIDDEEDENGGPSTRTTPEPTTKTHPVHKTDPYHIAGSSREELLPPAPFPHAPSSQSSSSRPPNPTLEAELSSLRPPKTTTSDDCPQTSAKRRHIDNITTILHLALLRNDWPRAARAWSLLLRSELNGRGPDIRAHGRWAIGGEILMRTTPNHHHDHHHQSSNPPDEPNNDGNPATSKPATPDPSVFTTPGLALARAYYDRLALQNPYTAQASRGILDARAIYPALFTVWIYEIQQRWKGPLAPKSEAGGLSEVREMRRGELTEATALVERMDELLLSPPFDSSGELLRLRGMVGLWVGDLHESVAGETADGDGGDDDDGGDGEARRLSPGPEERLLSERGRKAAERERKKALELFRKVKAGGGELPLEAMRLLETYSP